MFGSVLGLARGLLDDLHDEPASTIAVLENAMVLVGTLPHARSSDLVALRYDSAVGEELLERGGGFPVGEADGVVPAAGEGPEGERGDGLFLLGEELCCKGAGDQVADRHAELLGLAEIPYWCKLWLSMHFSALTNIKKSA